MKETSLKYLYSTAKKPMGVRQWFIATPTTRVLPSWEESIKHGDVHHDTLTSHTGCLKPSWCHLIPPLCSSCASSTSYWQISRWASFSIIPWTRKIIQSPPKEDTKLLICILLDQQWRMYFFSSVFFLVTVPVFIDLKYFFQHTKTD